MSLQGAGATRTNSCPFHKFNGRLERMCWTMKSMRAMQKKFWAGLAGLALCLACTAPALAQEWRFELTPYLWAAGLKGDVQAKRGGQVDVDASFSDVFENLDFGLMGSFEARCGRWMLLLDGLYIDVSDSQSSPRRGWGNVEVDITHQMYTIAAGYRVLEVPASIDLIGGARYTELDAELKLTPGLFPGRRADREVNWWDPFVGARLQYKFTKSLSVVAYGDVGGFDVGSNFSWQGILGVNYQFTDNLVGKVGYRYLYTDYDKDDFTYDMALGGFFLGLGIQF